MSSHVLLFPNSLQCFEARSDFALMLWTGYYRLLYKNKRYWAPLTKVYIKTKTCHGFYREANCGASSGYALALDQFCHLIVQENVIRVPLNADNTGKRRRTMRTQTSVPGCPVYRPTVEEFSEPLEYIASVRDEGMVYIEFS